MKYINNILSFALFGGFSVLVWSHAYVGRTKRFFECFCISITKKIWSQLMRNDKNHTTTMMTTEKRSQKEWFWTGAARQLKIAADEGTFTFEYGIPISVGFVAICKLTDRLYRTIYWQTKPWLDNKANNNENVQQKQQQSMNEIQIVRL